MIKRCLAALQLLVSLSVFFSVAEAVASPLDEKEAITCPASGHQLSPPDFSSAGCTTSFLSDVDPQNRLVWVKTTLDLDDTTGPNNEPLAIYISAKMASEFYLNGSFAGRNGVPGTSAKTETYGKLDAVIHPPQNLFKVGANEIIFKASSHHGVTNLENPIHFLAIDISSNVGDKTLRHYWPSFLTLGLFLFGIVYFAIMSVAGPERKTALIFSILCGFAASQLIVETSKALLDYSYPFHDVRLILITFLSTGFGFFIALHIFRTFANRFVLIAVVAVVISTVFGVILANGYDGKAEAAMLAPITISTIYVAWSAYQGQPRAFMHFLFLLGFIIAILAFPTLFLDTLFFFLVAVLLLFLFIEQGLKLAEETKELRLEAARVSQLELALEQADEREEASEINVKSAGRIERLTTDQIGHCRGVDGYTEIILMNGRKLLHSATLAEMEKAVPVTFLKVHRSYLVNTSFVKSLDRDPTGTGRLILTDGSEIPISRRIMPKVRKALG